VYIETVHPDHNCWYTPYTLKNVINKYSKTRQVTSMHWVFGSIVAVCDTMNKTIYVFWTEANELTPRRKNNLQIIKRSVRS
jgi:hypothetical protein